MRAALAGLALVLALAGGCRMTPDAPAPPPGQVEPILGTPPHCSAQNGTLQPVCRRQMLQCVIAYRDAGKACTDGDQCAGDCLYEGPENPSGAVTGMCQANSDPCGCKTTIEDGRIARSLCVD